MFKDQYSYKTDRRFLNYTFTSEGDSGSIEKLVNFSPDGSDFIISFVNGNDLESESSYNMLESSNGDVLKILRTLLSIINDFTIKRPSRSVYIVSTDDFENMTEEETKKIKVYCSFLSRRLDDLQKTFTIQGRAKTGWETFQKNRTYIALMLKRKTTRITARQTRTRSKTRNI